MCTIHRIITIGLWCVLLPWGRSLHAATFSFDLSSVPPIAQPAFLEAGNIWGGILVSNVPIKVKVNWFPLGSGLLGITFPNGRRDFPAAPVAQTWYATALANSIADMELNPGEKDIEVYLNATTNWYYGLDAAPGPGQYDLVTVALHELGHGLGFVGLAKKVGTEGSFGTLLASDFAPLTTSFPWPQLDTLPGIFDRFLRNSTPQFLVDLPNPSVLLGSAFTSNQIYWEGPHGLAGSIGSPVRMYAPATFALGSSCVHLNESTYPAGNPNELMTPNGTPGMANHWPGPIAIGIMQDIGWTLMPGIGMDELDHKTIRIWPNPVQHVLNLEWSTPAMHLSITDAQGCLMWSGNGRPSIVVGHLAAGLYLLQVAGEAHPVRFIKN
ncbi:MAG: T9SS type A sorting domain-containing protein [Flavobacteriales bacterium]|nr:T9SS type A sorting domain-containing protein [Flavobacteriales bacterium]